jgi:aminopeptidase N
LEPFVSRYFDAISDVWARRSSEVAQTVVVGLYPTWSITEQSVAAADEFLAGDHPPALARLVVEGRASVVRSLAARAADGA